MNRFPTLLPTLALMGVLAACSGGEPNQGEQDMMGDAPESTETAAAEETACVLQGATLEEAQARVSPHNSIEFTIGESSVVLCYGSPSVRGREIMGGLVPYGQPWRMGADEPTTLHVTGGITLGNIALSEGAYSIYAIPGESEWEIFINTNTERWGIPINAGVRETEIGSFTVVPGGTSEMVEQLTYHWEPAAGGGPEGELVLEWNNTSLAMQLEG